jgi:hypothetical protein
MVKVNEVYEIPVFPAVWDTIVRDVQTNYHQGKDTIIERDIAGEKVRCMVTGYTWDGTRKPNQPLKQRIKVQVTELVKKEPETPENS